MTLDIGEALHIDDLDGAAEARANAANEPAIRPPRLVLAVAVPIPQRRRGPRRVIVAGYPFERRHADRRKRIPGIDGLLRTVLSDNWP